MSYTCFETEGSSSERWLYTQERYSVFCMHQYKQSCRSQRSSWKSHPCRTGFEPVARQREIQLIRKAKARDSWAVLSMKLRRIIGYWNVRTLYESDKLEQLIQNARIYKNLKKKTGVAEAR